jgi:hypothetical protein
LQPITCVCFVVNKGQRRTFRLHDEQTVNGLRKSAQASVFHLKRQYLYNVYAERMELMENGNFRLFAADGNGKQKFVFLVGKRYTVIDD